MFSVPTSKRKLLLQVGVLSLPVALIAGCGNGSATVTGAKSDTGKADSKKAIILRLGDVVAEDNPEIASEKFFAKRLFELTNGQYDVKVYPNSVLGPHTSMNQQVSAGTLQFTTTSSADLGDFDKRLSIFSLPYLYDSKEKLFQAEDGKLGKAYDDIAEKYGFKILAFFDSGSRNIYNKKGPIKTPDDIKKTNLRLRTIPNPVMIETMNAFGAQAVPLNTNEIYNAIQQGVVDGAENSITFYLTSKHNEVATYFSLTQHFFSVDPLMVSLKWFNTLSPETQKAVVQAGQEAEKFERDAWEKADEENVKKAEAAGVKINKDVDIPAFQKAVQPVWNKFGPDFGELFQLLKESQ